MYREGIILFHVPGRDYPISCTGKGLSYFMYREGIILFHVPGRDYSISCTGKGLPDLICLPRAIFQKL